MAGTSYIYQFGEDCDPPYIQTDAEYLADAMRVSGWQPGVVRQEFLNKVDRQGNSIAAGLAAFMAAYESGTVDVTDDLSPTALSNILLDALSNAPLTTQPQFDASTKAATTGFVQRALGSLASTTSYAVNTNLTAADIGKTITPTTGGLAFGLPLVSGLPNGAQIRFNGNAHGCAISRQGSDIINNGTAGVISTISVLEYDVIEFTVIGGTWTVTDGNAQLSASSQFLQSKTESGYIKLPGGLILNWCDGNSNGLGVLSVSWAKPFSSQILTGFANERGPAGWASTSCTVWGFSLSESNLTTGVARVKNISGTSGPVDGSSISGSIFALGY